MGVSGGLAGVAGVMLGSVYFVSPGSGFTALIFGLIVTILGGLGSLGGTAVAAYAVGLVQSSVSFWLGSQWVLPILFGAVMLVPRTPSAGARREADLRGRRVVIREFVIAAAPPGSREGEKLRTVSRATVGALVLAYACLIPQISSDYVVGLLILMAIYAIVSMAWNLVFGYGGVLAFGQLAFFAIGGYAAVLANIHLHASPWEDIWFGGAVAGVAGLLIGIPSLRLYGPYMILFTLAFQLALQSLWPNVWTNVTGGSAGLFTGIDTFAVGGAYYITVTAYVAIGLVLLTYLLISLVLRSPIGHAMEALREGRAQAEARGISFFQHRVILFVISAFLTGVAGGLYAHNNGGVTPAMLDVGLLINIFAMLALGGIGTQGRTHPRRSDRCLPERHVVSNAAVQPADLGRDPDRGCDGRAQRYRRAPVSRPAPRSRPASAASGRTVGARRRDERRRW